MKFKTTNQGKNEERTSEYNSKWDTEKTLKVLIDKANPLIFDVGANNGSSINDFKDWWPESHIHCFEPQKECYQDLVDTAALYEALGSVKINGFAVGNIPSQDAVFYTHDINSGISGFNKINIESKDSINLRELGEKGGDAKRLYADTLNHDRKVEVIRLDDYIDSIDPNLHIDFLKIDTQGFEPEVLDGFGDKLANVDVVLTELMFYDFYERSLSFSDIERYLLKSNFTMYDISHVSKNPMNGRTDWIDVIYVNDRLRKT
jgi:FkbM family methyltransferase